MPRMPSDVGVMYSFCLDAWSWQYDLDGSLWGGKPKTAVRHDLAEQAPTQRERSADYVPVVR